MGQVVAVEPRPGAYVTEWRAIQVDRADIQAITRLLRPLRGTVFADLASNDGGIALVLRDGATFHAKAGDWLVLSPHDKVIILDESTFHEQFDER